MAKSEVYANAVLDAKYGSGNPATIYLKLYTALPNPDGTGGTEVSGGAYARRAVTNDAANFPAAADGSKSNANNLEFATATALWGTIVGVATSASLSGADVIHFGALAAPRTVNNGDGFAFAPGQLIIEES